MAEFRMKKSFEKAFKLAVTNFDETKLWFEYKGKYDTFICFVLDGKLKKLKIYRYQESIEIWKNYFIEFINTSKFDYNGYWELYKEENINPKDVGKVFKFPLCDSFRNQFFQYSPEVSVFLTEYRQEYKNCGIRQVPKPLS